MISLGEASAMGERREPCRGVSAPGGEDERSPSALLAINRSLAKRHARVSRFPQSPLVVDPENRSLDRVRESLRGRVRWGARLESAATWCARLLREPCRDVRQRDDRVRRSECHGEVPRAVS